MNYPAIKTEKLTKYYGSFAACTDIDLSVNKGDVFAFIGPNGAGKTTTIKMLTGILKPSSGSIMINNIDMTNAHFDAKRIIGYVPDRPFLYEKLSGSEFLEMVRGIYGIPKAEFEKRYNYYIELFEIKDWIEELIENYSHGMKQKLILVSAFAHDPEIFIMDEPLVGLDPKSAKILKLVIKNLAAKGKTFFLSTHILSLVEEICTTLAIINKSKILLSDSLENVEKIYGEAARLEDFFLHVTEREKR